MKILLAVSRRYARLLIDAVSSIKPKPKLTILSPDEEVAILAKNLGVEHRSSLAVEKLYTSEELEEYDLALIAMDDDHDNIAIARTTKSMNIPIIISVLNDTANRDLLHREGVNFIVDVNEFAVGSIKSIVLSDTWTTIRLSTIANLVVAFHRTLRRGVLGVTVMELEEVIRGVDVKLIVLERSGRVATDTSKTIETGETLVLIGTEEGVEKAMNRIEGVFRRHEEIFARRYAENFRAVARGYG